MNNHDKVVNQAVEVLLGDKPGDKGLREHKCAYKQQIVTALDQLEAIGYGQWILDDTKTDKSKTNQDSKVGLNGIHKQTNEPVILKLKRIHSNRHRKQMGLSVDDVNGKNRVIGQYDRVLKLTDTMTMESWYDGEPWTENSMRMYMAIQHKANKLEQSNLDIQRALTDLPAILLERGFNIQRHTQFKYVWYAGVLESVICPGIYCTYGPTEVWSPIEYVPCQGLIIRLSVCGRSNGEMSNHRQVGYIYIDNNNVVNDKNFDATDLLFK